MEIDTCITEKFFKGILLMAKYVIKHVIARPASWI